MRDLTPTERDVVRSLAMDGGTNREIAARLGMSPRTVSTHLQRIMLKLGQHGRAGVVAWAWRTGFVHALGRRGRPGGAT